MAETGAQLATGWLELVVSTQGAQQSMTTELVGAGEPAGKKAGSAIGSNLLAGLKKFAGPIAVLAAGFSVKKIVSDATEAFEGLVGQTNQLQRIAGGSAKQVSGLVGALQLAGVNGSIANTTLTFFAKAVGNAANNTKKGTALTQALGASFKDAAGNVKPMSDLLPGLADKFAKMPDGAQKAALAAQLFGRSGTALLPFLNRGSAGIAELTAKSAALGNVVDNVAQKTLADARTSTLGYDAATQGLNVTLGGVLLPLIDSIQNVYRSALIPVITQVTGFLQAHTAGFDSLASAIGRVGAVAGGGVSSVISGLGKAFAGVVRFIKPIVADLAPVFAQLGPVFAQLGPQVIALWSAFSPIQLIFKALLPILPQLARLVGTLVASLGGALGKALTAILPAITKVSSILSTGLSKVMLLLLPIVVRLATTMGGVLAKTIETLAPIVAQIATTLGNVLGSALTALMPLVTLLATILGQVLTAVLPLVGPLLSLVTPLLQLVAPILQLVGQLLTPLITLLTMLLTPILGLIAPLVKLLVPILNVVIQVFSAVLAIIVKLMGDGLKILIDLLTGNFAGAIRGTQKAWSDAWSGISSIFNLIIGGVQSELKAFSGFFAGIWNGIINAAKGAVKTLVGQLSGISKFFSNLQGTIVRMMAGASSWLFNAGKNMIQGLINGAGSLLRNIGTFFLNIVPSWIVGPFKSALGIHSPSKVFHALGLNITAGLSNGVVAGSATVAKATQALVAIPTGAATAGTTAVRSSTSSARGSGAFINQGTIITQDVQSFWAEADKKKRRNLATAGISEGVIA